MKFRKILFAALAMFAVVGCENPNEQDEVVEGDGTYTIAVDKDTIEADGVDCATFFVYDSNGKNVMVNKDGSESEIASNVYFINQRTGERLERRTKGFTAIADGEYVFVASVRGKQTTNRVTITAQNHTKYEKFFHKVCVMQITSTTCTYCPEMTAALEAVGKGDFGNNFITLACHSQDDYALPWVVSMGEYKDLGEWLGPTYGSTGYPYAIYDLKFGNKLRSESAISSFIKSVMTDNFARCGVKISKAEIDANGVGVIEASIKADKPGTYDIAWAVLADNQPSKGGTESIYHNVLQAVSSNFTGMSDQSKVTLTEGEEYTKTFNIEVGAFKGVQLNPENCKVVVMVHNEDIIDNANICAVGSTVDYLLN